MSSPGYGIQQEMTYFSEKADWGEAEKAELRRQYLDFTSSEMRISPDQVVKGKEKTHKAFTHAILSRIRPYCIPA